jgi:hypothetical protein
LILGSMPFLKEDSSAIDNTFCPFFRGLGTRYLRKGECQITASGFESGLSIIMMVAKGCLLNSFPHVFKVKFKHVFSRTPHRQTMFVSHGRKTMTLPLDFLALRYRRCLHLKKLCNKNVSMDSPTSCQKDTQAQLFV